MKKFKFIFFITFILALTEGCDDTSELVKWVQLVEPLQKATILKSQDLSFSREHHETFKKYFSALALKAYELQNNPAKAALFEDAFRKVHAGTLCSKTLISKQLWFNLIQTCTKNGFFLCAEEVRAYPDIVAALRSNLHNSALTQFEAEKTCRGTL